MRRYARILGETLPEQQAVFIERTAEQTLRVAACLAASECSETITEDMLSAASTLVRRSVQDTVRITKGADAPKVKRQPLSLTDKVRARIEMHGGRATSSQVLPYGGASASEVKALPEIVVTVERSGKTGRSWSRSCPCRQPVPRAPLTNKAKCPGSGSLRPGHCAFVA